MTAPIAPAFNPRHLRLATWLTVALWTLAFAVSMVWNTRLLHHAMLEAATYDARSSFNRDLHYMTDPAFMTRQVHELKVQDEGMLDHITSLKPSRPENAPDVWEAAALRAFEQGQTEVTSRESLNGQPQLRFMKPLVAKAACLECHADQGYKVGDIRGGISVAVPLAPYLALAQAQVGPIAWLHIGLWTLGVLGIFLGARKLRQRLNEQLQAEEALRASVDRYRSLVEESPDMIGIYQAGKLVFINSAGIQLLGAKTKDELLGRSGEHLIHPDDFKAAGDRMRRRLAGEMGLYPAEVRYLRLDGTTLPVDVSVTPIPYDGKPAVQFVARDITERKRVEDKLRQLSQAVEQNPASIVITDPAGNIEYVNPKFIEVTGYSLAEVLGKNPRVLKSGEKSPEAYRELWQTITSGKKWCGEFYNKRKNGELYWESASISPIRDRAGCVTHFVAVKEDITARKQAETELLLAKEAAESATRTKSEFLASMSHEIRTPMNGVIGMLGLLQDGELSERQREFAQIARSSADALLVVINDILDFSKIESGKMTIELVTFDLQTMVEEVGELFAAKVAEKGLDFIIRYAPNTPRHVVGDAGRIRQILTNLLGNAIKFTAQGHVLISIHCENQTNHQAQLKFSVQDTGIGIAEDKIGRLFEKFMQADASTTRRFGGTGLGLAISKQLTELMGGHMGVASGLGHGSIFSFTLPLELPTEALSVAPARTILSGVRVLIVDDNEVNRRVLHEQITSWHMRNGGYASGEEALMVLREARAAGDPYHIAVLDYQMPGMDGEMLARAIKADHLLTETVLVMLTSMGQPDDPQQIKEAGIFACLVKPVRQSKLWDVLAQAWGAHMKQSPVQLLTRPQLSEPCPGGKKHRKFAARVLVADDNTTNQRVARLMLENLGCRVDVAGNGQEAVEMLELLPYDVVFMDCEMPEMDGYEATAEIRRRHAGRRQVPIVAMTAKAIQGDREHCLKSGMDDYISKPVRLEDLEATLGRWFSQPARDVQSVPEKTQVVVPPATPALDPEVTERLRQLAAATDPAVLAEIYDSFLSSTVEYLATMRQAEQAGDANGLRIAAHSLKGASANVGAPAVAEISHQLELLGNSQSVAGAARLIEQLTQAFAKVKIEIENQTREETVV